MSWFSLAKHGKSLWDQHAFAKRIFTGNILGDYLYKTTIKENFLNKM
jgi:hypothetical protein